MRKNHYSNKFERTSRDFREWFFEKNHPNSRLNKTVFIHDLLKFIGLILVFLIIYNNLDKLNSINIWIIRLGSVILIVFSYLVIRKGWHLGLNLKYWFRGFNNGTKIIIGMIIVLILLIAFLNQDKVISDITNAYNEIRFSSFTPVNLDSLNISIFNVAGLSKSLNTCPQINVPINFYSYGGFNGEIGSISGKSFDGWTIHGQATCRKGTKEGENLNKYYCGGYSYLIGIGSVNAYVEKTIISKDGSIGKTYKHVIWNIYDENRNFIETKCLGDPDEFDKKQAEAFINELRSWS